MATTYAEETTKYVNVRKYKEAVGMRESEDRIEEVVVDE